MSANISQMDWYPPKWNAANIPPHLLMFWPPPETQPSSGPELNKIFNRLKWSVLDHPSYAQVYVRDDEGALKWRALFDKANKSLCDASAMDPPQSRLQISIEPLHRWRHWHDSETQHLRPASLLIENTDGEQVSVEKFIHAVYNYALPLHKLLLRCMNVRDPMEQDRTKFFFDGLYG
ncbi:hypothetical protein COCSADRAFT_164373 [Bipolaris sorokiniana ND90Pr]|uniref:Uncharacterized protein n=1 Tax=Cochliobolus sativus (strain ND90Pr / ATCC 201652) TaxID=665912 RepID=M2SCP4_COCSN|nr:uncharacterized protein COCSADRAFT_164373 [Bipolaris sorokiniana ND90Pr]EMD60245.1 hypothetical protein COCSADRAFT_164373 [Bipolaris sorokiniana ND90Pr]